MQILSLVSTVKFSQDGHCQLVSSLDNNIRLLDKDSAHSYTEHVSAAPYTAAAAHALYYFEFSLCCPGFLYCAWIVRYKGHKGSEYKIDSALTHDDACVVSGWENIILLGASRGDQCSEGGRTV